MRVSPILGRASSGPDYAKYRAYLATLTAATKAFTDTWINLPSYGVRITCTTLPAWTNMPGSPAAPDGYWANWTYCARLIQHLCPDQATFEALCANGREVYVSVSFYGAATDWFQGVARNGYTSQSLSAEPGDGTTAFRFDSFYYFDEALGPRRMERVGDGTISGPFALVIP